MILDLEQKLQKRLDDSMQKREHQQTQIKQQQADLQRLFSKIPQRPRETLADLDKKISDLEHNRTITSLSLAEERHILKQINAIKKSKLQVEEYDMMDKRIQDTKSNLDRLRDGQRVSAASIEEILAALSKVKLANKLGCQTQELIIVQVDCPKNKLGSVIGKSGSMIKQIEESAKVNIDIGKESNIINITGSKSSVSQAVAEIDKIIRSTEDAFEMPKDLLAYATAKHVDLISTLREKYDEVYIDVSRNSGKIVLRGTPEQVAEAKQEIMGTEIVSKPRALVGREFNILLGKKGATISSLVEKHKVAIEADKENDVTATAIVTGPPGLVDAAMAEIEELLHDNREVIENTPVDILMKRILMADGGHHMKALQGKVIEELKELGGSCYISFGKDQIDSDHPKLSVKAKQSVSAKALELTQTGMKELDSLVVELAVDPYIIPRIIGKGGETIKRLTQGKSTFVEVDRVTGKVCLGATSTEDKDGLLKEVNQLIEDNTVLRVEVDESLIKAQYRELCRSKVKAEISAFAWLDMDEAHSCLILRGHKDNLEKAKDLVEEFLANNYVDEVEVTEEDFDALLSGGKGSKIMKLSEETGVNLFADRSRYVVVARGCLEKVKSAKERLTQFLNGGDGHSVARLSVTEQVVGVIIGRGGSTRKQLEEKYGGVSINISKAHRVTIRGPEDKVDECRVDILKRIASARVTQTISVTEDQHNSLQKNDAIKRIMQQTQAHISIAEGKANIRGTFYDVHDAVSLLNEQLTGEYKTAIELDASQFAKVRGTARDPSHFERIESGTDVKLSLDLSAGSIVLSGKRSNVRKAKDQVFGLLDFILPGEIERLKLSKPLHSSVGQATALAEVSATVGGASVYLDRDLSSIVIRSPDPKKVKHAIELVDQKIKNAEKLAYIFEVNPAESWLIPMIIGKNGNRISSLQKESGCRIDVSKESRTVTVVGESAENVMNAREKLENLIEKGRRENVFVSIPEKAMSAFVGRGGSHIKELSAEHGVEILRTRKGKAQFKITGDGTKVEEAKIAIDEWVAKREETHGSVEIQLEKQFIPVILGHKGETARSIQEEFGCKMDINRQALTLSVRGGDEEKRNNTLKKIQEIIDKETAAKAAKEEAERQKSVSTSETAAEEPMPRQRTLSNDSGDISLGGDDKKVDRTTEFPSQPVGVKTSNKRNGKKNKKVGTSVQAGTEQGRNLFQLLVSEAE